MTETSFKSPTWKRAVQIGLGVLAIILAIYAIVYPGITLVTLVMILAIIFLIVGIERVISGIIGASRSRWASIGLGILVIILASIALAYPVSTTVVPILLPRTCIIVRWHCKNNTWIWRQNAKRVGTRLFHRGRCYSCDIRNFDNGISVLWSSLSWFNHRNYSNNNRHTNDYCRNWRERDSANATWA